MIQRAVRTLLLFAVVFLPSRGVDAQTIPSPYAFVERGQEAGVVAGWFAAGTDRFGLGPKSGPVYGLRYAVSVSDALALEAVASSVATTRDVVNPNRLEGDRVVEEAESFLTMLEARIRFALTGNRTWHGIQPFTLIGAGFGWDAAGRQVEDQQISEEFRYDFGTRFTGSFGGGVRWILSDRFHLRADVNAQLYRVENPDGYRDGTIDFGAPVPESQWVTSQVFTAGFAFRF